jgi:hypothetical protein
MKQNTIWFCKIGIRGDVPLPDGADFPMRQAIREAFRQVTGLEADLVFSGWGGEYTEAEAEIARRQHGDR